MQKKFILATLVILFFILLGAGSVLTEQCIDVGGCKQCWKTTPAVVQSELCGENSTCLAQPQDQQNNAIADALLCGCGKARTANYQDADLNKKIEETVSEFKGFDAGASEICEQPGIFLAKRSYT